jgi:cyclopropane-fatty-acyl-phospholipid synthase
MTWIRYAERGWIPDYFLRWGISRLLAERLNQITSNGLESQEASLRAFIEEARSGPIALHTEDANRQHYELPTEFFQILLGKRLKYSCCLWPDGVSDLDNAEEEMLALTVKRAQIVDGMRVLELGCGWGSLSFWMAEKFPHSDIHAVSNSSTQREYIKSQCRNKGIDNLHVLTADMNSFEAQGMFDRVVSMEMFEHLRNHERLMEKITHWLLPEGRLFVHIFCNRLHVYPFETDGEDNWMGRYFFTGGMMPSADLLLHYQHDLLLKDRWFVNGNHYSRTLRSWLNRLDNHSAQALELLKRSYGASEANIWLNRWRIFLMACEELFAYRGGSEWFVSHYLFQKR